MNPSIGQNFTPDGYNLWLDCGVNSRWDVIIGLIIKKKLFEYNTVGTVPKSNRKIIKRDTPNSQIRDNPLSWLCTGTSIRSGGVKLVLWTQTSPN